MALVGCPESEPSYLEESGPAGGPISWRETLEELCTCTARQGLVGRTLETVGSCCNPDALDRTLNAAGHPNGVLCLHGVFALLAACASKLSLHRDAWVLGSSLGSPEVLASLREPGLVHLASPVRLRRAPSWEGGTWPPTGDEEWWDLEIEPMLANECRKPSAGGGAPGSDQCSGLQTHTYRLRGAALRATFAPFPFGSRDLLWWRSPRASAALDVLSGVLLGLNVVGVPALAFVGSLLRFGPHADTSQVPDAVAPLAARDAVLRFADEWQAAAPHERHVVRLPRQIEFGLLPDAAMRDLWPQDFGFAIVCPSCAHVVLHFHLPMGAPSFRYPGAASLAVTRDVEPCVWPEALVLQPRWLRAGELRDEVLGRPLGSGGAHTEGPQLPWPAKPGRLLELWASRGEAEGLSFGACWPPLATAAQLAGVPMSQLGLALTSRVGEGFDLRPHLRPGLGFYDLFSLRKEATHAQLEVLVDKVALKERLRAEGIPAARILHASYESPELQDVLEGLSRYVVKAAHRHHGGRSVVLVSDGVDLRTGRTIGLDEVQEKAREMWAPAPDVGQPSCWVEKDHGRRCVTQAPQVDAALSPAVLVEELALSWDGGRDALVDEAFCFAAWGRLVLCGVMGVDGVWSGWFARDGTPIYNQPMHAETGRRDLAGAALRPGLPWPMELRQAVVALAERTAAALEADLIRVDVFPNAGSPIVAEASGTFG